MFDEFLLTLTIIIVLKDKPVKKIDFESNDIPRGRTRTQMHPMCMRLLY
jgi:hypothetical protein